MLHPETPFPNVGSYALLVDPSRPQCQQAAELVRILGHCPARHGASAYTNIAFPLRLGASGNRTVDFADLIEGAPLSAEEQRELRDLEIALDPDRRRVRDRKGKQARFDSLRQRAIWAPYMAGLLRRAQGMQAQRSKAA